MVQTEGKGVDCGLISAPTRCSITQLFLDLEPPRLLGWECSPAGSLARVSASVTRRPGPAGDYWGTVPRGPSSPPARWRRSTTHVTGAPAPPPGGRAEERTRLLGVPWASAGLGRGVLPSGEPRGGCTRVMRRGNSREAAFHCPGSNLLDTCMKLFKCLRIILFLTTA